MGIDWLGFNGTEWKSRVANDPEGSKQIVLDALASHIQSQHTPTQKGGLTADQAIDNKLAVEKFDETKRRNRVLEGQGQQRIDKPTGTKTKTISPEEQTKQLTAIKSAIDNFKIPKKTEGFFSDSYPDNQYLSKLVGGNIKSAKFSAGTKETRGQFPDGYYEIETKGGGKNFIAVTDKEHLFNYIAEAQGLDVGSLQSNNTKSNAAAKNWLANRKK